MEYASDGERSVEAERRDLRRELERLKAKRLAILEILVALERAGLTVDDLGCYLRRAKQSCEQ